MTLNLTASALEAQSDSIASKSRKLEERNASDSKDRENERLNNDRKNYRLIILMAIISSLFMGLIIGSYLTITGIAKIANAIDIDTININVNETKAMREILSFMNDTGYLNSLNQNPCMIGWKNETHFCNEYHYIEKVI